MFVSDRHAAEKAVRVALAGLLRHVEKNESDLTEESLRLRTHARLLEKANDRHRRFIQYAGVVAESLDLLHFVSVSEDMWLPAVKLVQRLPDLGSLLRRLVFPVKPKLQTFAQTPGLLELAVVDGLDRERKAILHFALTAAQLEAASVTVPVPIGAAEYSQLEIELNWNGLAETAPLVGIAANGTGSYLDVCAGGQKMPGRTLAARYQSILSAFDEFPPPYTTGFHTAAQDGWRTAPHSVLSSATLASRPPADAGFSLCVYNAEEKNLLVHPVRGAAPVWARIDGIVPAFASEVAVDIELGKQAAGAVEFDVFAAPLHDHEDPTADLQNGDRAEGWLRLAAGERSTIVRQVIKSKAARALWLGVRMAQSDDQDWYAHATFSRLRVRGHA